MIKKNIFLIKYKYKKVNLFFFRILNLIKIFLLKRFNWLDFLKCLNTIKNISLPLNFFINSNLNYDIPLKFKRFKQIEYTKKFVLNILIEGYVTFFNILLGLNLKKIFIDRFAFILYRFALKNRSIRSMNNITLYINDLYYFMYFFYYRVKKLIFVYLKINFFNSIIFNYLILKSIKKYIINIFYFIYLYFNKKINRFFFRNLKCLKNVNYYSFSFCLNFIKKKKNFYYKKKKINIYIYLSFFLKFIKFLFIKWLNKWLESNNINQLLKYFNINFFKSFKLLFFKKFLKNNIKYNLFKKFNFLNKYFLYYNKINIINAKNKK